MLYVRATSQQHDKVQEFLDQVLIGAKRQVLIEATVAEVQLQQPVPARHRLGSACRARGSRSASPRSRRAPRRRRASPPPRSCRSSASSRAAAASPSTLKLLEQFGDVRVLSSPKLSVMNNQTAILRVTRDIIYFTVTPSTQPITFAGGARATTVQASFTTTPQRRRRGLHDGGAAADQRQRRDRAQRAADHPPARRLGRGSQSRRCRSAPTNRRAIPNDDPGVRDARVRLDPARCRAGSSACSPG